VKVLNANGEPEYIEVKVVALDLRSVLLPVEALSVDGERRGRFVLGARLLAAVPGRGGTWST
jgi:hypothetical protein